MEEAILIVDDDLTGRAALARDLEEAGYRVQTADDGLDAAQQVATWRPDLVIAEALLPRRDGFELCNWLKSDARFKDLPVILLTSLHLTDEERRCGISVGRKRFVFRADRILAKPVCRDELLLEVAALLGHTAEQPLPADLDRVLVIDHDEDNATAVRTWLERDGYPIAIATTAAEGIEKSFSEQPDLILLAATMPQQDAVEIVRELRVHHDDEIAIVLMAQIGEGEIVAQAIKAGAHDYIRKPVNYSQLAALVLEDLNEHQLRMVKRRLIRRLKSTSADLMRKVEELQSERRSAQRAQRFSQAILRGLGDHLEVLGHERVADYLGEGGTVPRCCAELGLDTVASHCPVPEAYRTGRTCSAEIEGAGGRTVLCSATPLIDPAGRRVVVRFARDLTSRRSPRGQPDPRRQPGTAADRLGERLQDLRRQLEAVLSTCQEPEASSALTQVLAHVDGLEQCVDEIRSVRGSTGPEAPEPAAVAASPGQTQDNDDTGHRSDLSKE